MDEQKDLPLPEKELPSPYNMELRAPTFYEKYPHIKWLLPLIIILLVLTGTSIVVLESRNTKPAALQPTPTATPPSPTTIPDTALNWELYKGNYFSMKYPKEYQKTISENNQITDRDDPDFFKEKQRTPPKILSIFSLGDFTQTSIEISIVSLENKEKLDIDTWYKLNSFYPFSIGEALGDPERPVSSIEVGGIPSKIGHPEGQSYMEAVFVPFQQKMILMYTTISSADENDKATARQILSTFRFIDQQPSISPTCRPRPACLDATPRCLIPETADMCPKSPTPTEGIACTMEAKQCSDGSWVGRSGPNCEFAPCPGN